MLAPALPTHGPRIGLAAGLALAGVVVGAMFYAALFGWSTLVIDYLWFTLLVGIFLAGTLSAEMCRAEAKGGTKEYGGWPGPRELAFFLMVGIIFAAPALLLPVPMDTDAQGFGYLALALRNSGSLTTLAPFHPEITYLYSPGFPALLAYLSHQLQAGLQNIQLALGAVLSIVFVWIAYDFGNEIDPDRERRTGIVFALCALIGTDIHSPFEVSSHYLLTMFTYHGGLIVLLSAIGIMIAARRRNPADLLMLPWLVLIIDFSSFGILQRIVPWLVAPLIRYDYPFSIAWHGPIIPYMYFGGMGILWVADRIGFARAERWIRAISLPAINIVALIVVLIMLFVDPLLALSKGSPLQIFSTFSSKADVQAMDWLQRNAPADAMILNYPAEEEADCVPIIAQRNPIYFRPQPFFRGTAQAEAEQ